MGRLKRKASAYFFKVSAPNIFKVSLAKTTLLEVPRASLKVVTFRSFFGFSFRSAWVRPWGCPRYFILVLGEIFPFSRAAAAVTSLKREAAGEVAWRLNPF